MKYKVASLCFCVLGLDDFWRLCPSGCSGPAAEMVSRQLHIHGDFLLIRQQQPAVSHLASHLSEDPIVNNSSSPDKGRHH